jgi:RAP1 GTPase activating protein 1
MVKEPNLPNELLAMEERQVIRSYKFGVGYVKPGQTTEEQMMANTMAASSLAYKQFLNFLGETIDLQGWKGYRAGLDTSPSGLTGSQSIYTKWQGYEIMFHVSTLLPFKSNDRQQLERKRHIGNDIVVIIFQDDINNPLNFQTITSHQNHVLIVVAPFEDGYKVVVANKNGVPSYTPELPEPLFITKDAVSRDFFLHKLVNGERASYKAPNFASKISRTRTVLLYEAASKYLVQK